MVVAETLLFSVGAGGILGYCAARAVRLAAKIVAVVSGAIVLVLAYLSYRGDITVNWNNLSDQTQSGLYNASHQVMNLINNTATKFASHPSAITMAEGTPIAGACGFACGFAAGIRH